MQYLCIKRGIYMHVYSIFIFVLKHSDLKKCKNAFFLLCLKTVSC